MSSVRPTLPPMPHKITQRVRSEPLWTARRVSRPISVPAPRQVSARVTRRFEYEWLQDGLVESAVRVAPALPVFEQAFGAFTHGILIQTTDGPVAVEDLVPGMHLECAGGRVTRLTWKGAITLVPGAPSLSDEPNHLYRVMPDTFGLARPQQDQTFGPHARRLDRSPRIRAALGTDSALVPIAGQADGIGVIEVHPVAPTRVYHLGCDRHEVILAAGMEVESYHPGPEAPLSLSEEMMAQFMAFFPHLGGFAEFGRLAAPRIKRDELAAYA